MTNIQTSDIAFEVKNVICYNIFLYMIVNSALKTHLNVRIKNELYDIIYVGYIKKSSLIFEDKAAFVSNNFSQFV